MLAQLPPVRTSLDAGCLVWIATRFPPSILSCQVIEGAASVYLGYSCQLLRHDVPSVLTPTPLWSFAVQYFVRKVPLVRGVAMGMMGSLVVELVGGSCDCCWLRVDPWIRWLVCLWLHSVSLIVFAGTLPSSSVEL